MHGMLLAVLGSFRLLHAGHVVSMSPGAERLLAFVALADRLTAAGRSGEAAIAARAAIRADPLRESARACLIRVHLAEGNLSEALRQFERFGHLLKTELGLAPTPELRRLVQTLL